MEHMVVSAQLSHLCPGPESAGHCTCMICVTGAATTAATATVFTVGNLGIGAGGAPLKGACDRG
jgi:hypothetical protein